MLTITSAAAAKLVEKIGNRPFGIGIKVGVKTTGCSGLAYSIEYVDNEPPFRATMTIENSNYSVFIAPEDQIYFLNATLDYVKDDLKEGFEFFNPIERNRCGCGKSFQL